MADKETLAGLANEPTTVSDADMGEEGWPQRAPDLGAVYGAGDSDTQDDLAEEACIALGGAFEVNGVMLPPPTTAVVSLLSMIDSPYVRGWRDDEWTDRELLHRTNEALYVLCAREQALQPVFAAIRARRLLNDARPPADAPAAVHAAYFAAIERNATAWCVFDQRVSAFAESLGTYDPESAGAMISEYLRYCRAGYDMIPGTTGGESSGTSRAFGSEWIAQQVALVQQACPGASEFDVLWRMPLAMAGHYVAQAAIRSGVKGVGRANSHDWAASLAELKRQTQTDA